MPADIIEESVGKRKEKMLCFISFLLLNAADAEAAEFQKQLPSGLLRTRELRIYIQPQ